MQQTSCDIDPRELRRVLGAFVTGVTVVTTLDGEGKPIGLTANSFSSVSLDPPLVLWSLARTAPSHQNFFAAPRFAISILADDQYAISNQFARPSTDKFGGVEILAGRGGVPLIAGASAWIECDAEAHYPGGDHTIFLGRVRSIHRHDRRALAFGGGRYAVPTAHDLGSFQADLDAAGLDQLQALRAAREHAARLSRDLQVSVGLAVWGNLGPTIVHWEASPRPLTDRLRVGMVVPILGSASGLVLASHMPESVTQNQVAFELGCGLVSRDDFGPRSPADVAAVFADVRAKGICSMPAPASFTRMYRRALHVLSAPVLSRSGKPLLCVTLLCEAADAGTPGPAAQALLSATREIGLEIEAPLPA
jgi:flavin reductase (DIM6/NTAB) family NADH-FMN oxidoreductase RutF/DNA-binding IclR family transcriptional regulator